MTDKRQDATRQDEHLGRRPVRPGLAGAARTYGGAGRAADDGPRTLTSAVAVRRHGRRAWLQVTGHLTALTPRHLDDWLDWLITTGAVQVTVSLATVEQIDEACVRVLRVAQARLRSQDGDLLVTAAPAPVRAALPRTTWPTRPQLRIQAPPAVSPQRDTVAMPG